MSSSIQKKINAIKKFKLRNRIHKQKCFLAGKIVRVKNKDIIDGCGINLRNMEILVEDWADRISNCKITDNKRIPGNLFYLIRMIKYKLPRNNKVIYGHTVIRNNSVVGKGLGFVLNLKEINFK